MIEWADIVAGLAQKEFFLEYLPTVTLADGVCVGAEALIRWQRSTGVVLPLEFIPAIENTPLSGVLTYWVIERLAQDLGEWLQSVSDLHISINVPPEILGRGGVAYATHKAGLGPVLDKLMLEITERGVPDQLGVMGLELLQAQEMRPKVALDDVGLGGSNLVVLSRVCVDYVKLDKSVVDQIQPGHPLPELLRQISALTGQTEIHVIAEGIETMYQAEVLRQSGVSFGQGWLFSRPLSASAFRQFFEARQGDRLNFSEQEF